MKIRSVSFVEQGLFSIKLLGVMSKAIKLSLNELAGQCRNTFLLAFSAMTTSLWSVNTEKAAGNSKLLGILKSRTGWQIYDAGGTYPSDQD